MMIGDDVLDQEQQNPVDNSTSAEPSATHGSIQPEPMIGEQQVTVQISALVDDFGAIHFEVYKENISFYFGTNADAIHIAFTDQSLMNLAKLVNHAVRATLSARGIPVIT
jgi:hypothetical protein